MARSRVGVHAAGRARIGVYTTPRTKALLELIGTEMKSGDMTSTIEHLVGRAAFQIGITDAEGRVTEPWQGRVAHAEEMVIKTK